MSPDTMLKNTLPFVHKWHNKNLCRPVPQYFNDWVTKIIHWATSYYRYVKNTLIAAFVCRTFSSLCKTCWKSGGWNTLRWSYELRLQNVVIKYLCCATVICCMRFEILYLYTSLMTVVHCSSASHLSRWTVQCYTHTHTHTHTHTTAQ